MKTKSIVLALLGTFFEYYDYALYGFSASILAQQFFPEDNPTVGLLKTFGIFLAGTAAKLLGGIIFGSIGDKWGRSRALKITMLGIAIPTILVGLLPAYEIIGWLASFLLLLCRILQGMFVSGESDGVRIYLFESIGQKRPCFAISLFALVCMIGTLLASFAVLLCQKENLPEWSWRLPFIVGGLFGLIVFVVRHYLIETPAFLKYQQQPKSPKTDSFWQVLNKNKAGILLVFLLYGVIGADYHFYFVFWGNYISTSLNLLDPKEAQSYISQALIIYTLSAPIAGLVADRFGAIRVLKISIVSLIALTLMNLYMIHQGFMLASLFMLTAAVQAFFHTPGYVVLFNQFSVDTRFRCVGVGHAMGSILLSGSAPVLSLWIWQMTSVAIAPLFYSILLCLLGFLSLIWYEYKNEVDSRMGNIVLK